MESVLLQPIISSNFNKCGGKPVRLGIDEAGRGCVLGAMVYACFFCAAEDEKKELKTLNVDDSKKLKEGEREEAFEAIQAKRDVFGWSIHAIRSEEISAKMLRKKKYSLNEISHDTAISLILRTVKSGVNVTEVAEKADSLFPVVSAASILAKVTRDRMLVRWTPQSLEEDEREREEDENREGKKKEKAAEAEKENETSPAPRKRVNEDEEAEASPKKKKGKGEKEKTRNAKGAASSAIFGSGYPGDSETIAFLNRNCDPVFGFDGFVRFSWSTARLIFEKRGVPIDWYEEVDEEEGSGASDAKQSRITNFFAAKREATAGGIERPAFFLRSKLQLLSHLSV
ncbi:UNVERIFIED_CONTAM: ribonuclease H1 large subunit, putative [Hammondia hammondi]|eukprot:XP_008887615.1 ribonuclease H1 large subunit, putative [Hammondia hammondi]